MRILALIVAVLAAASASALSQGSSYSAGQVMTVVVTLPATCMPPSIVVRSSDATMHVCTATNTFTQVGWSTSAVPAGAIVFVASGTCPAGYAEVAGLNGKMLRGTVAANGNVGTTGGADSVTPTFTGNSVSSSSVSGGTPAGTNSAPALTMNSYTPTGTNGTVAFTPAGTNATGTVTPLGTIAWPVGVPTYAGTLGNLAVTAHTVVATKQGSSAGNVVTTATHTITGLPGGTVAWPAGVPTLAGSSSVTSAQTFTGSSGTVPAETFTGQAAVLTGSVAAPTFTGSALAGHQHTTTATGSISAVDTRAAFIYLIGCQKT